MSIRTESRSRRRALSCLLAIVWAVSACVSAKQYELDIELEPIAPPRSGRTVVLAEVRDARAFIDSEQAGDDAASDQLATGGVGDPAITQRAFGQMRSAGLDPLYDLLLPPGRTVSELTREALEAGFHRAGVRVLAPGDPGAEGAAHVDAEIVRFWVWNHGSWTFTLTFDAEVALQGARAPFPFPEGRVVTGAVDLRSAVAARPQSFVNTTTKGLDDFIADLEAALRSPDAWPAEAPAGATD
jgi:hypothetical protein